VRRIGKIVGGVILFSGLCLVLGFAVNKQGDAICRQLDISVQNQEEVYFLDEDMVLEQIAESSTQIVGAQLSEIDIQSMRDKILANPGVDEAVVTKHLDGRVEINISQRVPICRIVNSDGSGFYLDKYGRSVPLSDRYTSKVPVFIGSVQESSESFKLKSVTDESVQAKETLLDDIFNLASFISEDPFWNSQVDHILIEKNKEFVLHPRVGNHKIVFGEADNIEAKFEKLMAFYNSTINKTDLNKYTVINLKYRDQVVCTKRSW
jgi:cell division protein FtsQ